ncbi:MAG: 6,7-dimethyl-8-ribityllumazine synthase [Planctomycetota bacterium]|jgi:6,7-dimethyl-8-ribityllumazine synthase
MHRELENLSGAEDVRVGLAVSRYHGEIAAALRAGAVETFRRAGGRDDGLTIVEVPGSFELTAACAALAGRGDLDAAVAIGCVISGETTHDQYICQAVAHGLTQITLRTGLPVAFGVLTCQTIEQARARAGGDAGNKGAEAMAAAIRTVHALRSITATGRVT